MAKIIYLSVIATFLLGCNSNDDTVLPNQKGSLHGRIVNSNNGETISDAYLSLLYQTGNIDKATLNCDNGYYTIEGEVGSYVLKITIAEYLEFIDTVTIISGANMKRDLPILKDQFLFLHIVDDKRNDIKILDFDKYTISKMFNIFNDGTVSLNWSIGKDQDWITVSLNKGVLEINDPQTITVTIDRDKLKAGENTGGILVVSNNGHASLKITAYGKYTEPEVECLSPDSYYESSSSIHRLNAIIMKEGNPAYKNKGFCYSTKRKPTVADTSYTFVANSRNWNFSTTNTYSLISHAAYPPEPAFAWLEWHLEKKTYYVRAWVEWRNEKGKDTIIYSENVELINVGFY
jgi:hypothetical protein